MRGEILLALAFGASMTGCNAVSGMVSGSSSHESLNPGLSFGSTAELGSGMLSQLSDPLPLISDGGWKARRVRYSHAASNYSGGVRGIRSVKRFVNGRAGRLKQCYQKAIDAGFRAKRFIRMTIGFQIRGNQPQSPPFENARIYRPRYLKASFTRCVLRTLNGLAGTRIRVPGNGRITLFIDFRAKQR